MLQQIILLTEMLVFMNYFNFLPGLFFTLLSVMAQEVADGVAGTTQATDLEDSTGPDVNADVTNSTESADSSSNNTETTVDFEKKYIF